MGTFHIDDEAAGQRYDAVVAEHSVVAAASGNGIATGSRQDDIVAIASRNHIIAIAI